MCQVILTTSDCDKVTLIKHNTCIPLQHHQARHLITSIRGWIKSSNGLDELEITSSSEFREIRLKTVYRWCLEYYFEYWAIELKIKKITDTKETLIELKRERDD